MDRPQKKSGAAPCANGATAKSTAAPDPFWLLAHGSSRKEVLKPTVIEVSGNEEFLDKLAAIFAEQVLAAQAEERGEERERRNDG